MKLLRTSCRAGAALGCGGLGSLYVAGLGVPKNVTKGRALFVRACGRGDGLSCESLGGLLVSGRYQPRDIPGASRWYDRACALGRPAACAFLAAFIRDGALGASASRARIPQLLTKACAGRVSTACKMLGDLFASGEGVARDRREARRLYGKACSLGSRLGCAAAAGK